MHQQPDHYQDGHFLLYLNDKNNLAALDTQICLEFGMEKSKSQNNQTTDLETHQRPLQAGPVERSTHS